MLFYTHEFFVLLLATLGAFAVFRRSRQTVLLAASVTFYAYAGLGMATLFFSIVVFNFWCYRRISNGKGRGVLAAAMAVDLTNLFTFKYTSFFLSTLAGAGLEVGTAQGWVAANVILPVGISFYTFQLMALLIDSYRGSGPRVQGITEFFLFATFFGQLIAGPIMRGREFIPQLRDLPGPTPQQIVGGVVWFGIGLAKKVILADTVLAPKVDELFATPLAWDSPTSWFFGLLFGFQIYYDFAGYCDMAVGLGKLFGLELKVNFATPYVARSPSEFWSRWNITLSRWFGDYVYLPLGGSRVPLPRTMLNVMVTMLVSGLWHGAGWTFVVWGALHGAYLAGFHGVKAVWSPLKRIRELSRWHPLAVAMWALTFLLTVVTWVYFRAGSITQANGIVAAMFGFGAGTKTGPLAAWTALSSGLLVLHFAEWRMWLALDEYVERALAAWRRLPGPLQAALAFPVIVGTLAVTKKVQGAFIYFQF